MSTCSAESRRGLRGTEQPVRCASRRNQEKDRSLGNRPFLNPVVELDCRVGLEILVRRVGRIVSHVLGSLLGIADRLLAFALEFLSSAFTFHTVGTDSFARALFCFAGGFVGGAFYLVCH